MALPNLGHIYFNQAFNFIAPHVPSRRGLPGKKFNAGDIPHKGNDLFPDNIRFFAVLLYRRDDELVNICGLPFGMAPSGQQTYFGVPSCPEPQPIEPAIRPAVFLQPDKRHCFIAEPP